MKTLLFPCMIAFSFLLLTSCQSDPYPWPTDDIDDPVSPNPPKQLTEEELKQQLLLKECSNSTKYLSGKLGYDAKFKNLISLKINRLKLNCSISNNATLATFKDIGVKINFISKTGTTILQHEFVIYEFVAPNSEINYKTEMEISNQAYKDIERFEWKIVKASCK